MFRTPIQHDRPGRRQGNLRRIAALLLAVVAISPARGRAEPPGANPLIGYTELRTDLPGGRHANVATMRAAVVGDWTAPAGA